ncbi:SUN domain-containing protein 3-like isoform X2 [Ischnura elegans]|uniref:SUN domain-containing protein 3-like isoform X2 n=1 Tax=Ischnura elegans TaxID=197161 RepID=UPI001ED8870C|nr:SUN domain-containing protein 3-like isoform X2 [Ischnura elegans]
MTRTNLIFVIQHAVFAVVCPYDRWTSRKQSYEIMQNDIQEMKEEFNTVKKILEKREDELKRLLKLTCELREDIKKDTEGRKEIITNILTDSLKPLNEIILKGGFSADGTGKVDFALESTGGKVVNTPNTEPYALSRAHSLFGLHQCQKGNLQAIIQPGVLPGQCWAFKGSNGRAVIQLIGYIYVTSVTMEHIPVALSPSGNIESAPREFSIWGLMSQDDEMNAFYFGNFSYDKNGPPAQTFNVQYQSKLPYPFIELRISSNHGEKRYTCVYRLRVHGELVSFESLHNVI